MTMVAPHPFAATTALARQVTEISNTCVNCPICARECAFLQRYGKPKEIADRFGAGQDLTPALGLECSLCGLCEAVCPVGAKPVELFLAMRRVHALAGPDARHAPLAAYEAKGVSPLFSWMGLPEGCDTVLFPGCTLPGTRPTATRKLFDLLQGAIPGLGVVLNCCAKPGHDRGDQPLFHQRFDPLRDALIERGVTTVLVACPNCHTIFSRYGGPLKISSVYEHPALSRVAAGRYLNIDMTVHDPCATRHASAMQRAVRAIVSARGVRLTEMTHSGSRTLCCGEGGAVGLVNRNMAEAWTLKRAYEANEHPILTYCAGCASFLGAHVRTVHLLDMLTDPLLAIHGKPKVSKAPFTYLNRLLLKRWLKKRMATAYAGPRPYGP